MDTLFISLSHRLRSFDLELELEVSAAETFALVGPSGAGKTSILRAVAGLLTPDAGTVRVGGETWLDTTLGIATPPERRSVGLVFQDYALFPHLTVAQNVAYGGNESVRSLLEAFGLETLARAKPNELSGGERQRVAVARALARRPGVLLLDEPLAALDMQTRARVRGELAGVLRRLGLPTIVVTHDFADASALAQRIGVIVEGRIVQVGTAAELVAAPTDRFVADFTGANLIRGIATPGADGLTRVTLEDGTTVVSTDPGVGPVGLAVYPWEITLGRTVSPDSAQNHVRGTITSVTPVANRVRVAVGPLTAEITDGSAARLGVQTGETMVATFKATATRLIPLERS